MRRPFSKKSVDGETASLSAVSDAAASASPDGDSVVLDDQTPDLGSPTEAADGLPNPCAPPEADSPTIESPAVTVSVAPLDPWPELADSAPADASRTPAEADAFATGPSTKPARAPRLRGKKGRAAASDVALAVELPSIDAHKPKRERVQIDRADRFNVKDLLSEATAGIGSRPGRLVLTILGTVLGIASVVVTVGMAQTASNQINKQFDAVAAQQVLIQPATQQGAGGKTVATGRIPWDAEERIDRLNGVLSSGAIAQVNIGDAKISTTQINDPSQPTLATSLVMATSPGLLDAVRGQIVTGRYFDQGHSDRQDRVVVLGANAAEKLGVHRVDTQPSIFIGENAYAVIGIIDNPQRRSDLKDSVIMPFGTAIKEFGLKAPEEVHIHIAVGAGEVVGHQAPIALDPDNPEGFKVKAPPAGSKVRESVQADINSIFLALGAVALLVGGIGIANVTLLSVMERVGEIGLRRALGATRRNIGGQFVAESVIIGLLGGLIGAALGVLIVVGVSVLQDWTPILDWAVVGGAAALGGVIGLAAGFYPAMKAANVEPIAALRGGV